MGIMPKFIMMTNPTRGARGEAKLICTLHESPATTSLHSVTPKEKHSLLSCFGEGEFF